MSMVTDTKRILRTIRAGRRSATSASSTGSSATTARRSDGERTARTGCVDTKKLLAERIIARYATSARALRRADGQPGERSKESSRTVPTGSRPMAEATMAEVRAKMGLR